MQRSKLLPTFCCLLLAVTGTVQVTAQSSSGRRPDKAAAYYHFTLGHMYSELAAAYNNRTDYLNKAIENYRAAIKADPGAGFLSEELADLYIQAGRIRDAVVEAEQAVNQNPNDTGARRILGRIYMRLIGDPQQGKLDEKMLPKAIEQYHKIAELSPKDVDALMILARLHKIAQNSVEAEKSYKRVLELEPDNEDALTGLAMVYADVGDTKSAAEMLRRVNEKTPSLRTLSALASAYEQMRDYSLAAETLRRALEAAPGNPEVRRAYAQNLLLSDQLDEALRQYQAMAAEDPKDAQSQLRISQIYRQKRDFEKAREAANKARDIDPQNLDVRYNEVSLLEAEGKLPEAINTLLEIVKSTARRTYSATERGNRVLLLERLGLLYRQGEQHAQAVEIFRQVGELDPELGPRAAAQVIDTWRLGKNFSKAVAESESAIQKYPKDRVVRAVRASVLAEIGRGDEAASELKKLLDGKSDRETWISLAQVYEKSKNYPEMANAIDAAEKLSQSKDEKEAIAFMRGAMLEKLKKFDAAEAEFRKVLEANPRNASALNYLGYMLADRNVRLQEAHDLIRRALEEDPNNGAYLDSLGWVYYRMGKLEQAETNLRRALERYAKDPT
ncbi:MAG TPA: tetratricopeptide repeat protein, partial [Bryobacteraceae bacterium]|nr:tetratricopeptide repeat protein [Bryobacteraceae bacterium]